MKFHQLDKILQPQMKIKKLQNPFVRFLLVFQFKISRAFSSCHGARDRGHPGQVSSLSQG